MAPKQSKAITIFRLLSLGYYYMVSSCCERQVGDWGLHKPHFEQSSAVIWGLFVKFLNAEEQCWLKNNGSTQLQLGGCWFCRWWVGKSCLGPGPDTGRGATGRIWAAFRCSPSKLILKNSVSPHPVSSSSQVVFAHAFFTATGFLLLSLPEGSL